MKTLFVVRSWMLALPIVAIHVVYLSGEAVAVGTMVLTGQPHLGVFKTIKNDENDVSCSHLPRLHVL